MALHTYTSLGNLLKWVQKTAPTGVEGAPAPAQHGGKPADDAWVQLSSDLSDLPRNERWLLRPIGGGKAYCAAFIVREVRSEEALALPLTREEALAAREALVAQREDALEWLSTQQEAVARGHALAVRTCAEADRSVRESRAAEEQARSALEAERTEHHRSRERLLDEKQANEAARQIGLGVNRLIDSITLWRAKSVADIPPAMMEELAMFLEEQRKRQSISVDRAKNLDAIKKLIAGMSDEDLDWLRGELTNPGESS